MTDATFRSLIRRAAQAASSHNTQPWKFRRAHPTDPPNGSGSAITILPDFSRRCHTVDSDDHHLFVSLGCAAENLVVAAEAGGLAAHVEFAPARAGGSIEIALEDGPPAATPLFDAIDRRQCTRALYDGHQVPADDLRQLERAAGGDTCAVILLTEPREIETVAEYVAQANALQSADPKFVNELMAWFRFNRAEAVRTGDGLYAACTGSRDLPRWLGRLIMRSRYWARARNDLDMKHIRSSAGVAVFVADRYTREHWIDVGRHYERFALLATALGVRNALINQPAEAAVVRAQFASWLGLHRRTPDLIVRFGYGPEMPWSRRRPVEQLLA